MLSNKVSKTLFKSLLKWNRRPEVIAAKFNIDLEQFGIDKHLPKDYKVIGHEGVQAAIYHAFRNNPVTEENLDLCFGVMKQLNELASEMKSFREFRLANLNDEQNAKATFKIGQIVRYKKLKFRGVVTGWHIDKQTGDQKVEVVFDMLDVNENMDTRHNMDFDYIKSEHLTLVDDKFLARIYNPSLHNYFIGYNESINRYIPKQELMFLFPRDFEAFDIKKDANSDNSNTVKKEDSLELQLNQSSERVMETVQNIGIKLENIIIKYVSEEEYQAILEEMKDIDHIKRDSSSPKSTSHPTIIRQVLDEFITAIKLCKLTKNDAVTDRIAPDGIRMVSFHEASQGSSAFGDLNDISIREKNNIMYQRLRRGGEARKAQATEEHSATTLVDPSVTSMYDGLHHTMDVSYEALRSLTKCFNSLDQLMQLRFQAKGVGYLEDLRVVRDANGKTVLTEYPKLVEEFPDASKSIEQMNQETTEPPAHFEIGQVVHHKLFDYRGIVCGYDQKPLANVKSWEAVTQTTKGQEQPFYKVLSDDRRDTSSRSIMYAAQDNLELVKDKDDMLISHKNVRHYFLGFDDVTTRYIPKHKLSYCFPSVANKNTSNEKESGFVMNSSDYSYDIIDKIVVEAYTTLKESFSTSRKDYMQRSKPKTVDTSKLTGSIEEDIELSKVTVDPFINRESNSTTLFVEDLMMHMRHSSSRDNALVVESILWLVWIAHDNNLINKVMRMGVSHLKRGNVEKTSDAYSLAASIDPNYSEAHNKLAALHHQRNEDEECLKRAKTALALFPQHFGALSGMGLAHEKLGNFSLAKSLLRQALAIHPWAANLPTIVMDIEKQLQPREKYRRSNPPRSKGTSMGTDTTESAVANTSTDNVTTSTQADGKKEV